MEKILITGGSGFIGTNLVQNLLDDGIETLNLDQSAPLDPAHSPYYKKVDLLDQPLLAQLIEDFNPTIIVHLAAVTDIIGTTAEHYLPNTQGTQNIIDIAAKLPNLKKVVYTSSMYVCKPGFIPKDYDTYAPHTTYGESKVAGEKLVKAIKEVKYDWVIVRPTSIWGPWFNIPYIDFFNIVYQKKYFDFGKACTKSYGYVGNTVYQLRKIMAADDINKQTFYLGDLPAIQISEWANEISIEMKKGPIKKVPFFVLKTAALVGDVLKVMNLKFPMTSFRLSNMTTDNVLPVDNTMELTGKLPYTRIEGVRKTLKWMSDKKGYKF
jgi:nucleoside-diphosphate-sugar epimerase